MYHIKWMHEALRPPTRCINLLQAPCVCSHLPPAMVAKGGGVRGERGSSLTITASCLHPLDFACPLPATGVQYGYSPLLVAHPNLLRCVRLHATHSRSCLGLDKSKAQAVQTQ